ncbi:MAG TPA: right-handed parallel beta-helix repeat-containing protein [Terracidiphilus sp.]|jgi:hypothetical protein|nr:right-handed parallel beta-helix repeat-containing protein [Terracidiphilus sp.]
MKFFTLPLAICALLKAQRPMHAAALLLALTSVAAFTQNASSPSFHSYFVDCSASAGGDGSSNRPWNTLAPAQAHLFEAGDTIALARGAVCHGAFSPQGSGVEGKPIRLTAYGQGPQPRIVAPSTDRQVLMLFNQEYWQIDSLDLSGSSKYGIFVSGDKGTLHHIYLKNLSVHDVQGGELTNKDNGLILVGPSGPDVAFEDVLVDGAIVAHTNQWAGILIGGGNYAWKSDAPLNHHIVVRNSSVQDVYGDGIVLFRDSDGLIETSTAWQTGMQATETNGTPNAIWTWTCTDCTVRDNEAFLTDSPGVDGGAYDIDWDNTRNVVERNYAHDTQGYCIAAFAAGYKTIDSLVRDNLCIDNGLSPRLAALQGAIYLHTWNDGEIKGLRVEGNTIVWNPPVSTAAAIQDDAGTGGVPVVFSGNRIESDSRYFYHANAQFAPSANTYRLRSTGDTNFTIAGQRGTSLAALQAAGIEQGSTLKRIDETAHKASSLRIDATVDFALDADGLLTPAPRAQLMVLRSLALQYGPHALQVAVHLHARTDSQAAGAQQAVANALLDLDAKEIRFEHDGKLGGSIRLLSADGKILHEWRGFQNAATLGGAVRSLLGVPHYAEMLP